MKKTIQFLALFATLAMFSQAGHIMQGVGAINMSMGGAATGQPLDISGALLWNPAAISHFDGTVLKADVGLFFSSPELRSTVPVFNSEGQPTGEFFSGITEDDRGLSPMPALALVWGKMVALILLGFQLSNKRIWSHFPRKQPKPYQCLPIDGRFWSYRIGLWCFSIWSDLVLSNSRRIGYCYSTQFQLGHVGTHAQPYSQSYPSGISFYQQSQCYWFWRTGWFVL
ncbi:MAG: hypothetical protein R2773_08435 [Flavobacteriaceae bacterium]